MLLGVSSSTFCISWNCIQKYNSSGSLQKPRTIDHRWFVSAFWKFVDLIHFHANFWGDFHVLGSTQHWLTVFTSSTHRIPFLWHSQWTQCGGVARPKQLCNFFEQIFPRSSTTISSDPRNGPKQSGLTKTIIMSPGNHVIQIVICISSAVVVYDFVERSEWSVC